MARSTEEWVSKHDDQKVPPRVRQRVFDRFEGICHITGQKIQPGDRWELEHRVALILGGEHRESNLAPALSEPHKKKTALEMALKSKISKVRGKHTGAIRKEPTMQSAGFAHKVKNTDKLPVPGPKQLFERAET